MDETVHSSNQKNSILLSRNSPVALVVGAAGFLGSHLVDKLLEKKIQVVGVDDLDSGQKRNLDKATENRDFHLLIESPEKIELELPRLDYIFITVSGETNLSKIWELFGKHKSRCLLVSSIDLYVKDGQRKDATWLKETEGRLAKFAADRNLNARVLRLGPVYGPRMDFAVKDPLIRLITQALNGDLQKEVSLDFSSRALYIADAIDLIIRTIFAGSTAQKIFDGVRPTPLKVGEIKQVLLDPVWYEQKEFIFSELPPWPTPNLEKTIKTLNWRPVHNIVSGLKKTLSYFKDNEIPVSEIANEEPRKEDKDEKREEKKEKVDWSEEKREVLEAFKQHDNKGSKIKQKKGSGSKFAFSFSKLYLGAVLALITYALIWPALVLGWGIFSFQYELNEGFKNLSEGKFEKSLDNIQVASAGLAETKSIYDSLEPVRKTGLLAAQFTTGDQLIDLATFSLNSARSSVSGVQALLKSVKAVTGEATESPKDSFELAQVELSSASEDLSRANAILKGEDFNKQLPSFLAQRVAGLAGKLELYSKLVSKGQALSILLPKLVALDGKKDYLVLLQNNMELRPTGGFIGSFAKISFEGGKLKKLSVNDIYNIDGQLNLHVEPPKEIKDDLGQKDWFLRDSNWEPDFPTSARQAEWFYTKETGERVEGVIALDISAMESLLETTGPLDLPDYKEKVTAENLFERAVSHAELSFFPGSQAKKSFLTALSNGLFEKIFFLPQNNWPGIISALGKSLDEKHISFYLNDPKLFSYLISQNWAHVLPRQSDQNANNDFLSLVEANLGANKANYYLDRSYNLETVVGKYGEIKHRLRINYINRSPSDTFPGGKYKNRLRLYLPFSSKLTRALWGEADITKDVTGFVDYGRSGYSLLVELAPKEQKTLVLDYIVPIKLNFQGSNASYRLDIIKQAGTGQDPWRWNITYPISYRAASVQTKPTGPQEQTVTTDLSVDRSFQLEFKK